MLGGHCTDQPTSLVQQAGLKVVDMQIRIHGQLGIVVLLAVDHGRNPHWVRDAEITFVTAIINDAVAAVDLRAGGHLENQDVFALIVYEKRRQDEGWVKFLGVVREIDNLSRQPFDGIRFDAHYRPVIGYTQEDGPAILIEKGADGLEETTGQFPRRLFALHRCALAPSQ